MTHASTTSYSTTITDDICCLYMIGDWTFLAGIPDPLPLLNQILRAEPTTVCFDARQLQTWDSGLMIFLVELIDVCSQHNIVIDQKNLPEGVRRLLNLAYAVPERKGARRTVLGQPVLAMVGNITIEVHRTWNDMLTFLGDLFLGGFNLLRGRARLRLSDLFYQIEAAGPSALMIITLISTLVGMILAFVGAVQLRLFGAEIFIANLVGLGMAREMGAI